MKKVIAYVMHEREVYATNQILHNHYQTEGYFIGEASNEEIKQLRSQGIIVEEFKLDKNDKPLKNAVPSPTESNITRGVDSSDPALEGFLTGRPPSASGDILELYYNVQLNDLLVKEKDDLEAHGATIVEAMGENAYKIKCNPASLGTIKGLSYVEDVTLYDQHQINVPNPATKSYTPKSAKKMKTYDIRLNENKDLNHVVRWLRDKNVNIVGQSRKKIRIMVFEDSVIPMEIRFLKEVNLIEEYVPPKLHNNRARLLIGIDEEDETTGDINPILTQTGAGQIIGVADTGIDDQHPDLQNRIVGTSALGRDNDYSDPNGHGTHVAGSVLGDGASSNGQIIGVAPQAELFFQSLLDQNGDLGGLPLDLYDLFEEAYLLGARIHNKVIPIHVVEIVHEKPKSHRRG